MNKVSADKERPDQAQILLRAQDVDKSYLSGPARLDVLTGINLEVYRGEILVIVGASGVGKSTLLHILGALDHPTRGTVELNATDIFSLSDKKLARVRNRAMGFIFQFHHLLPEFTALENVAMPLLIDGRKPKEAEEVARGLLGEVGLDGCVDQKPGELSGGEQQRVAVARALVKSPLIVLADEPSGNLDRPNSEMLHDLIWRLSRSKNQTFVIVTHNEKLAARADRLLRLSDGTLWPETL